MLANNMHWKILFHPSCRIVVHVSVSHTEHSPMILILLSIWQVLDRPNRNGFGVRVSICVGSMEFGVSGREFSSFSVRQNYNYKIIREPLAFRNMAHGLFAAFHQSLPRSFKMRSNCTMIFADDLLLIEFFPASSMLPELYKLFLCMVRSFWLNRWLTTSGKESYNSNQTRVGFQ